MCPPAYIITKYPSLNRVKPAHKGKATLIMDTGKYKAECYRQLNNPKFYKRLPKDIAHQVEDRIRFLLKRLVVDDEIEENTQLSCPLIAHVLPNSIILPKIHKNKDNPPGRPIVSTSSYPTECISEFVDYQLNPLVPKFSGSVPESKRVFGVRMVKWGVFLPLKDKQ